MTEPEALKRRLEAAGVPQTHLAREVGLSKAMVSRALNGERRLTPTVRQAAEELIRARVARAAQALVGCGDGG